MHPRGEARFHACWPHRERRSGPGSGTDSRRCLSGSVQVNRKSLAAERSVAPSGFGLPYRMSGNDDRPARRPPVRETGGAATGRQRIGSGLPPSSASLAARASLRTRTSSRSSVPRAVKSGDSRSEVFFEEAVAAMTETSQRGECLPRSEAVPREGTGPLTALGAFTSASRQASPSRGRRSLVLEDVLDHPGRADPRKLDSEFLAKLPPQCLHPGFAEMQARAEGTNADPGAVVAEDLRSEEGVPLPVQAEGLDADPRGRSSARRHGHERFLGDAGCGGLRGRARWRRDCT